jgi:hypothetical protein
VACSRGVTKSLRNGGTLQPQYSDSLAGRAQIAASTRKLRHRTAPSEAGHFEGSSPSGVGAWLPFILSEHGETPGQTQAQLEQVDVFFQRLVLPPGAHRTIDGQAGRYGPDEPGQSREGSGTTPLTLAG